MTQFSEKTDRSSVLLPACYLAPAAWYAAWLQNPGARLEVWAWYQKQQLSSRCWMKTSQGALALTIHVERRSRKAPLIEKRVSLQDDWRGQHLKSWQNYYRHTPYFEFWEQDLVEFYQQEWEYLLEWLRGGHNMICRWMEVPPQFASTDFFDEAPAGPDFRNAFGPKPGQAPGEYTVAPYAQAYEGYMAGLSVMDLLFALGPEARGWLLRQGG